MKRNPADLDLSVGFHCVQPYKIVGAGFKPAPADLTSSLNSKSHVGANLVFARVRESVGNARDQRGPGDHKDRPYENFFGLHLNGRPVGRPYDFIQLWRTAIRPCSFAYLRLILIKTTAQAIIPENKKIAARGCRAAAATGTKTARSGILTNS